MDYREFSQKIKEKYPGTYDDMDDEVLARKIVEKYPQYSDVTFDSVVTKGIGDKPSIAGRASNWLKNIFKGAYGKKPIKAGIEPITKPLISGSQIIKDNPEGAAAAIPAIAGTAAGIATGGAGFIPAVAAAGAAGFAGRLAEQEVRKRSLGLPAVNPEQPKVPFTGIEIPDIPGVPERLSRAAIEGGTQAAFVPLGLGIAKGVGAVAGKVGGVADFVKSAYRTALATQKGTNRQVIDLVFDSLQGSSKTTQEAGKKFFDAINKNVSEAKKAAEASRNLPVKGAVADDVEKAAFELSKKLRQESFDAAEEAAKLLDTNPTIDSQRLADIVENLQDSLKVKGEVFGSETKRAYNALESWKSSISKATKGTPPSGLVGPTGKPLPGGQPVKLSELDLKKIIKRIDADTVWDGPADEASKRVLRSLRKQFDDIIKENTAYKDALVPSGFKKEAADKINDAMGFRLERGYETVKTDQTASKIKSILAGKKDVSSGNLEKAGLRDIIASAKNRIEQESIRKAMIKLSEKNLKGIKVPSEIDIAQRAETAARAGIGSPAYQKLEKLMVDVLGKKDGPATAKAMTEAAARNIFDRSKGSTFTGMNLKGLAGAGVGKAPYESAIRPDRFLSRVQNAASDVVEAKPLIGKISELGARGGAGRNIERERDSTGGFVPGEIPGFFETLVASAKNAASNPRVSEASVRNNKRKEAPKTSLGKAIRAFERGDINTAIKQAEKQMRETKSGPLFEKSKRLLERLRTGNYTLGRRRR